MASQSFDIFCRVVDNYGDIGVCWRLARQLAQLDGQAAVRLWVDDLRAFARIEPALDPALHRQTARGVEIILWPKDFPDLAPHDIVIEAFACDLPAKFIARMVENGSLCVNLEYLSAEKWVESCHALPSLQASGLRKCFYFPGFTNATGGLLREPGLLETRDNWLAKPGPRWRLLQDIGMPAALMEGLRAGWRQVYLFCYPSAPAGALIHALNAQSTPSVLLAPGGLSPHLRSQAAGHVHVFEAPFVSQEGFDRLLWSSDLNFVRGEDSLVRAIWAGKPLVWQIYEQQEQAHLAKLQAWLELSPYGAAVAQLMQAWNGADDAKAAAALQTALAAPVWTDWRKHAAQWCAKLAAQPGLAQALAGFCAKNRGKE